MIAALVWKEYREHRNVWVALAGLAALSIAGMFYLLDPPGVVSSFGGKHTLLMFAGFVVAGTYGVVCGAMMLADERDSGTLPFLDALTARRTPIWRTKLLVGLIFTLLQALFIATLVVPFVPRQAEQPHETQVLIVFAATIGVALEAFVWGFFLSGFFRHALTAAGTAAVVVVVLYTLTLSMALVATVAAFVLRGVFVLLALWGSWRMFCREDAERAADVGTAASLLRVVWAGFIGEHAIWGRTVLAIASALAVAMFVPDSGGVLTMFLLLFAAGASGAGAGVMALGGKQPAALAGLRGNFIRVFAIWLASVCSGLLVAGLLVLLSLAACGHVHTSLPRGDIRGQMVWTCLETFAGGLLVSTLLGKARSAFGAAMVLAAVLAVVQVLPQRYPPQLPPVYEFGGIAAFIATIGSALIFLFRHTRFGARRHTWVVEENAPTSPAAHHPQARVHAPSATRLWPIVWLTLRQARVLAVVLAVAALGVGLAVRWYGVAVWPVFTLLVGILCGIGVYGEQSSQTYRFLGDQRLPPGRVWLVKTGVWLALAVLICALAFLPAALIAEWQRLDRGARDSGGAGLEQYLGGSVLVAMASPVLFLTLWLAHGFAVGQFFGLFCTKPPVAVVLSLLVAPVLSALWIPSLVGGGLHLWQVFLPPLVLLAATRLAFWTWTAGGLHRPRPILIQAALGLLALACLGGGLGYRVLEVPDLGEPFDVAAFEAGFPTPEQNQAGSLIRTMGRQFQERYEAAARQFPAQEALPPDDIGTSATHHYDPLERVLKKGWSAADGQLARRLDFLFEAEWPKRLPELASLPLGIVEDPRLVGYSTSMDALHRLRSVTGVLCARALQQQARGDNSAALDHLVQVLALSRNLRNRPVAVSYLVGLALESAALNTVDLWLQALGPQPDLLRRALDVLNRHEADLPPLVDLEKAEYVMYRSQFQNPASLLFSSLRSVRHAEPATDAQLLAMGWHVPWEKARRDRLLNGLYVRRIRQAEGRLGAGLYEGELSALGPADDWGLIALTGIFSASHRVTDWRPQHLMSLCRVRAARLKLALLLYQIDQGKTVQALEQLVPGCLAAVPRDPFRPRAAFSYRVSHGQALAVPSRSSPSGDAPPAKPVPAGWGIIWSAGLDLFDNGGHCDGSDLPIADSAWQGKHADLIFLVPNWTDKNKPIQPSEKGGAP